MATLLTKNYKKIGQIVLQDSTYDNILYIYGKAKEHNADNGKTTALLKVTYYRSAGFVSFTSATLKVNGNTAKSYSSTTKMESGETNVINDYEVTLSHNEDGTSKDESISISWTATNGGNGSASIEVEALDIPLITVTDIKKDSARVYVSTFDIKGLSVTGGGWDITDDPEKNSWDYVEEDVLDKIFTNLKPETTYYVRAYVITSEGGVNSPWISFTTKKNNVVRIGVNGEIKEATPYICVNGVLKEAVPYIQVNGEIKEIN